ncbi:MAG TPA: endonuclease/exonuclease/phosphatase family protein, partial [Phototrophicaceae bacterium]|nr:endonuclease/exonuclease/phosphatase family protein [Phototrophicaceae bacterium]
MRSALRSLLKLRYTLEAGLIGLFMIQALRYLIAAVYARIGSASIFPAIDPATFDPATLPGLVNPTVVTGEITLLFYMLLLPMLAILLGRVRGLLVISALVVAVGRALMLLDISLTTTAAAAITLGGGLLYLAFVIRHRARVLPYLFIYSFAADQVYRAFGNTLDPSLSSDYARIQLGLSAAAIILALINFVRSDEDEQTQERSLMPIWGGLGLGGLLYLEISLLATPNAVAGRAKTDYTLFVPFLLVATMLPLIPQIREWGRRFIGLFDSTVRGWAWMLVVALLIVSGTRASGVFAGIMLVLAQFCVSMMWWWLVRPQAERERSFSGLWLTFSAVIFMLFVVFDLFTYEYAYVRDFAPQLRFLNNVIPPLLRGFRGLGLGVILLAVFLAALPMVQTRRRIPWKNAPILQSLMGIVVIVAVGSGAAYFSRPIVAPAVRDAPTIRVATYNIHAGYNEFFNYDLEAIALTIARSGADVVLLQEVEAGRMTSFGVDEPLWLARRVTQLLQGEKGMDVRFYATNEGLQGLAVLSSVPIVFDDGNLLTSAGNQTGLQRIQIQPDDGVITVYNTWLGVLTEADDSAIVDQEQDQQFQLNELLGLIAIQHRDTGGRLGRTVIGGTFNNVPGSDLIQKMVDLGFNDSFAGQPAILSDTFWQTTRHARLDYLWLQNLPALQNIVI